MNQHLQIKIKRQICRSLWAMPLFLSISAGANELIGTAKQLEISPPQIFNPDNINTCYGSGKTAVYLTWVNGSNTACSIVVTGYSESNCSGSTSTYAVSVPPYTTYTRSAFGFCYSGGYGVKAMTASACT